MIQTTICDQFGHDMGRVNCGNYVIYPGCLRCKKTVREIEEGR